MSKSCPCHHCTKRYLNCHDTCEEYKIWHKEGLERNSLISREKLKEHEYIEFTIKSVKRHRREGRGGIKCSKNYID
jgi:hypothetical protein